MNIFSRTLTGILVASALLVPVASQALSIDELNVQIAALVAQITALQQKMAANATTNQTTSTTPAQTASTPVNTVLPSSDTSGVVCPVFNYTVSRGARGDAVTALQKFLAGQGFLSADSMTGFYGTMTEAAVRNFQAQQSIVSSGSADTTGWGSVGRLTSAAIVKVCSAQKPITTTPNKCTYTPAPTTSCNGTWTPLYSSDNCLNSWQCVGQTTITSCPVYQRSACPAGQHYQYGATTYDANGCGIQSASCVYDTTVTSCPVYQRSACPTGQHYQSKPSTYDQNGCEVPQMECVADTTSVGFGAIPSSGAAPLNVGFYVSNFSGTTDSYSIDFGDGSGTNNSGSWSRSVEGASLYMSHVYANTGTYTARLLYQQPYVCNAPAGAACTQQMPAQQTIGTVTIIVGGTSGTPSVSVSVSPSTVAQGSAPLTNGGSIHISWSSVSAPTDSAVQLWLMRSDGKSYGTVWTGTNASSGSGDWAVPGPQCDSSGSCWAQTDSNSAYFTDPGTYYILAKLYTPANACAGGCMIANLPTATYLASSQSSTFTISGASVSGSLSIASGDVYNPVTIQGPQQLIDAFNSCVYSMGWQGWSGNGISVDWGDGTTAPHTQVTDSTRGQSCTGEKSHRYASPGTYTVKAGLWHPGPTDAPVSDWQGTATAQVHAGMGSASDKNANLASVLTALEAILKKISGQ